MATSIRRHLDGSGYLQHLWDATRSLRANARFRGSASTNSVPVAGQTALPGIENDEVESDVHPSFRWACTGAVSLVRSGTRAGQANCSPVGGIIANPAILPLGDGKAPVP